MVDEKTGLVRRKERALEYPFRGRFLESRADWIIALLLAIAAAALVAYRLNVSLWYDETWSYGLSLQPWHTFLGHYLWGVEANMALYYGVLRAWLWLTGLFGANPTEVIVRIPSAIFAVAATVVVYLLGRRLFGRVAGIVAAALYLANFLQLLMAQQARSYGLELFLLAVSWYCLFAALDGGVGRRWWVGYVIGSSLAVYAALFSGLVLAAQVSAMVVLLLWPGPWRERIRAAVQPFVVSLLLIGLLSLPILIDAAIHGGPNTWILPAHLGDIRTFFLFISGNNVWYERLIIATGLLGGALALLAWAAPAQRQRVTRATPNTLASVIALSCWLIVPIVLSFALTQRMLNLHLFLHRYLVVVVPAICLLVGLGVAVIRWRPLQLALVAVLALVAWPQVPQAYQSAQVQNFHDPMLWVQQRYQSGDGLICDPVVQCGVPVDYYLTAYPGSARLDADSPGRFIWETTSWVPVDKSTVLAYAASHRRVFFLFGPLGNGASAATEAKDLEAALAGSYKEIDHMTAHAVAADTSVYLYQVTP